MTQQQAREQLSDILLELEENETQLRKRRVQARSFADTFYYLAERFRTNPENVTFINETDDLKFRASDMADPRAIDLDLIKEVRDSVRKLESRQAELRERKAAIS
ncbi:MAG: hypothetical protein WBQ68_09455 [Terriglobales bacterium]